MPIDPDMRYWIRLDQELVGALDSMGCHHSPQALNEMLTEYGMTDFEERRLARQLMRCLGSGRAEAFSE